MLNQCILVGLVINIEDVKEDKKITLEIRRNTSKEDEYDYLPITVGKNLANAMEYLHEGSTLGVKARLISDDADCVTIIAEKLTFINVPKED